jgi:ABC-type Zn uptake system ZnuABC Zn-binding protein ZnuA
MEQWQKQLAPFQGTKIVVYHESWEYFLDWIGFEEAGTLEPKPGVPPSPRHVAKLVQQVKDGKVRLVLQESFYPTNLSKVFAQKTGADLVVMPTMVKAMPGTDSYVDLIDKMVSMIIQSLTNQGE